VYPFTRISLTALVCLGLQIASAAAAPEQMNLRLLGNTTLNGAGKGGEGLALKQYGTR